jgi:signal transduction histidine kinase
MSRASFTFHVIENHSIFEDLQSTGLIGHDHLKFHENIEGLKKDELPGVVFVQDEFFQKKGKEFWREWRQFYQGLIIGVCSQGSVSEFLVHCLGQLDGVVLWPFQPDKLEQQILMAQESFEKSPNRFNLQPVVSADSISSEQEIDFKKERLATLGQYNAQIIHNLKAPMAIIFGNLEILKRKNEMNKYTEKIEKATKSIQSIIDTILDAERQGHQSEEESFNLNKVIRNEVALFELDDFYKYEIRIVCEFKELPLQLGAPAHFAQIIGNFIKNAGEAMKDQGPKQITIKTYHDGCNKYIQVQDNGIGMDQATQAKIFQAGFSSKTPDSGSNVIGSGLGLSFCQRMVRQYGGEITVESKPREGTTFIISLPIDQTQEKQRKND